MAKSKPSTRDKAKATVAALWAAKTDEETAAAWRACEVDHDVVALSFVQVVWNALSPVLRDSRIRELPSMELVQLVDRAQDATNAIEERAAADIEAILSPLHHALHAAVSHLEAAGAKPLQYASEDDPRPLEAPAIDHALDAVESARVLARMALVTSMMPASIERQMNRMANGGDGRRGGRPAGPSGNLTARALVEAVFPDGVPDYRDALRDGFRDAATGEVEIGDEGVRLRVTAERVLVTREDGRLVEFTFDTLRQAKKRGARRSPGQ